MADSKIMHPVTKNALRPTTEFGGTQVRDESSGGDYSTLSHMWDKAHKKAGSKGTSGAGHTIKTHRS